jgi:membrane associated rhomboid family serine protease
MNKNVLLNTSFILMLAGIILKTTNTLDPLGNWLHLAGLFFGVLYLILRYKNKGAKRS